MKHLIRSLAFTTALVASLATVAQHPYTVTVTGTVSGCTANSYVNIASLSGTQPTIDIDVPVLPPNCTFSVTLNMASQGGGFTLSTPCLGTVQSQVVQYQIAPVLDSAAVSVTFNCGNTPIEDCLGVPGGNAMPGTACTTFLGVPGTWSAGCECIATTTSCNACYTMAQVSPFTAVFGSCSTGASPLTYIWDFSGPGGGAVEGDSIPHTFPVPGQYVACLNITDAQGCTSSICQQIYVDANGGISMDPPAGCNACILPVQSEQNGALLPYVVDFTSCSAGTGALSYLWTTPAGNMTTDPGFMWQFNPGPGPHTVCLTISDAMGCTSTVCDSLIFDSLGYITNEPLWYDCMNVLWGTNLPGTPCQQTGFVGTWSANCTCEPNTVVYDCLQIPNGLNMPGTPCTNPGTGATGTWSALCECVPTTGDCNANFWIMQAYENGDTTGTGTPVPNTLWVWNLSSGGSGLYQFLWSFGDSTSSTDPFPTHTYAGNGPYILCLSVTDSEGCSDTYCDSLYVDDNGLYNGLIGDGGHRSTLTVNVVNPLTMAVDEQHTLAAVSVWPNPAREQLNIALTSEFSGTAHIEVVDLNGRLVRTVQERLNVGGNRILLNTEALPAGLYAVRIGNGTHSVTQRFVRD